MSEQSDLLIEKINLFFPAKLREKYTGIVSEQTAEIARLKAEVSVLLLGIDAVQLDTCTQDDWDKLNACAFEARKAPQ